MLADCGKHRLARTGHRRSDQQNFRVLFSPRNQAMRQPRIKMRRVARLQIVSFARQRQRQRAGQNINPFLAVVMVMLIAAARNAAQSL